MFAWTCHLVVVVKLGFINDLNGYAGGELVPGVFNPAGKGQSLDKYGSPWSSKVGG